MPVLQQISALFRRGRPLHDLIFLHIVSFCLDEGNSHHVSQSRSTVRFVISTNTLTLTRAHATRSIRTTCATHRILLPTELVVSFMETTKHSFTYVVYYVDKN